MSKTSKKRSFPKLSKLGKLFKLKRSKKKANATTSELENCLEAQNNVEGNKTRLDEHEETTALLHEKRTEDSALKLEKEKEKPVEQMSGENSGHEDIKAGISVEQDTGERKSNGVTTSHVLDSESKSDLIAVPVEIEDTKGNNNKNLTTTVSVHHTPSPERSEGLASSEQELVSAVHVHTSLPKQSDMKNTVHDDKDEELAFKIIFRTPSPKIKRANKKDQVVSVRKDKKDEIDEDDFCFSAIAQTPSPKKLEKRDRVLTVKKIRSIIATPYKRLKREGSLLDGQTYRYIEVQSLVNAFQSMHPCIGSMIACNEKGLQYGKSSVLRIECKECNTKVFLQASKN
jgi:hypothetical protein